jgi:hypothetical protein
METSHTLGEDAEPPSIDSRSPDSNGYRAPKSPPVHESLHGRKLLSTTIPLKKRRIGEKDSLSSPLVPAACGRDEQNGLCEERVNPFDEDDDHPPSTSLAIESRDRGILGLFASDCPRYRPDPAGEIPQISPIGVRKRIPSQPKHIVGRVSARPPCNTGRHTLIRRHVRHVSRFRSVPSGRLSPPGTIAP